MTHTEPKKARYKELGYTCVELHCWRVVDLSTDNVVGPQYRTKTELLADLDRYARFFGCDEPAEEIGSCPEHFKKAVTAIYADVFLHLDRFPQLNAAKIGRIASLVEQLVISELPK